MSVWNERLASILMLLLLPSFVAAGVELPPASSGSINGTMAIRFWPTRAEGTHEPIAAVGCQVAVVPADAMMGGRRYDCGAWFQPQPGRYLVWMEQETTISAQTFLMFDILPFRGTGHTVFMAMKPAGWVRVDAKAGAGSTIRLLSLENSPTATRAFDRRLEATSAGTTILVPAGEVIAGTFDALGNATALSKPVTVPAGGHATLAPREPKDGTDVLVSLIRTTRDARGTCTADAIFDEQRQPPDALLTAWDRVVAVWYGVRAAAADVDVRCGRARLERKVNLKAGTVRTMRDELR